MPFNVRQCAIPSDYSLSLSLSLWLFSFSAGFPLRISIESFLFKSVYWEPSNGFLVPLHARTQIATVAGIEGALPTRTTAHTAVVVLEKLFS